MSGAGWRLANAGESLVRSMTERHKSLVASRGVGSYYGSESGYKPPAGSPPDLRVGSCIGWALDVTGAAYREVGLAAPWQRIYAVTVNNGGRGTVLCKELVSDGWSGIYWNPDAAKSADGDAEHTFSAKQARGAGGKYYGIPVKGMITDYRPSPGGSTIADTSAIARLEKVPFWVGCARGGKHVFVGVRGNVSEFHWTAQPGDPDAITQVPLQSFSWLSGILCTPPGVWESV
jgi:hypothetical protein